MSNIAIRSRLSFLMSSHTEVLNKRFANEGERVMPHVLAIDLGLTAAHGVAVINILYDEAVAEVFLVVYHACEPDVPAGYLPYGQGFPALPWPCPICEEDVEDTGELRFDIECRTKHALTFY